MLVMLKMPRSIQNYLLYLPAGFSQRLKFKQEMKIFWIGKNINIDAESGFNMGSKYLWNSLQK